MNAKSLAANNPHLSLLDDNGTPPIYCDDERRVQGHQLSSYLNIAVPKLLARPIDKSLFSYELEQALDTPELKLEFGPAPHNVLRVCDFSSLPATNTALDLTQDFGATAQYISQHFDNVDAIKLDIGKAKFSAQRFPHTSNICHISSKLDTLALPEGLYDLIYVGDHEALGLNTQQTQDLLHTLQRSLSQTGVLVFNTKNRDRLSKWLSVEQSATDSPMPYHDLYNSETKALLNLAELGSCLLRCGLSQQNTYASYSDNDNLTNLFSRSYIESNPNALNHFYRIGSVTNPQLNEYLFYKAQHQQGQNLFEYASRYVVIASNDQHLNQSFYNNDFAHFAGTGRLPQWRTITSKRADEGSVTKVHTLKGHADSNTERQRSDKIQPLLSQDTSPQAFQQGPLLIDSWLSALLAGDDQTFTCLVREYYAWLSKLGQAPDDLQGAYDLLPFNVVCTGLDSNTYQAIDPEWRISSQITAEFIVFRALFWLAFENRALMTEFCEQWGFKSIGSFVEHYLGLVTTLSASTGDTIQSFIALEERAQTEISQTFNAKSVQLAMHQDFSASKNNTHPQPVCQITWADENDQFEQARAVHIEWPASSDKQTLRANIRVSDPNKTRLRIDPIDNAGLFEFDSVSLLDANGNTLWGIGSSAEIAQAAELRNVVASARTDSGNAFIALNDDPFFLFDLSELHELNKVAEVRLSVSLSFEPNYHNALNELRDIVARQTASLAALCNKGHETRADIDLLKHQLAQSNEQCLHLQRQLNTMTEVMQQNASLRHKLARSPSGLVKRAIKSSLQKASALFRKN